jgi:putative glutamine amidotransferase
LRRAAAVEHEQPNPRNEVGHEVLVKDGTLLKRLVGKDVIGVNSAHHQAVLACASSLVVSGTAPDGVIEAIEHPDMPYCLGVQWHPEYHVTPADDAIWQGFVKAAEAYVDSHR